jgi:hypothetical protein
MKKHYILNRPMFNRGGVSAYGKGIASNLVTEEQRQRFNYGGRVGLQGGSNYMDIDTSGKLYQPDQSMIDFWKGTGVYGSWDALEKAEEEKRVAKAIQKDVSEREIGGSPQDRFWEDELNKARFGESDKYTTSSEGIGLIEKKTQEEIMPGAEGPKEVMTDSDWMDLLGPTEEQKKRTKGETQLNLAAAALDVFSQPTIAKGMKAASPHLSKLAQTASADQKARDKAILQGKVLSKVYTDRAGAKGEADVKTLEAKAKIVEKSDTPRAFYEAAKVKDKMKDAMSKALNYKIQTVKKDDNGIPIIPEGTTEDTVMWDDAFMILKDGDLVPITVDKIFALKKK